MGRAIVRNPKVFLFDEPLSNLDAKLRVQMRAEIKELHQRLKTTTVYVTHDQIEAMTMADKIVVMHDGVVEQMGAPLALYDRPENLFVAGFIGSPAMNVLKGRIEGKGFVAESGLTLPLGTAPTAAAGKPAIYGIRPEHIVLSEAGLPVEVVVVEPTGSETLIVVRSGEQELSCLFRERILPRPGETIRIRPDPAHVHLFDDATGRRIN
jgi:multiple sugar transport system ATP-binding protein